jgi:hypothetical protein
VADGPFWTSAGMTAGIDLALGFVETDAGAELARSAANPHFSRYPIGCCGGLILAAAQPAPIIWA